MARPELRVCACLPSAESGPAHAPALPRALEVALKELAAAQRTERSGGEVAYGEALAEIEAMAADAGLDRFFPAADAGEFLAYPLTGRTAARLGGKVSFGVMSFGQYGPPELTAEALGAEGLAACHQDFDLHVTKGRQQTYVASYTFRVTGTPVVGVHSAIASYVMEGRRMQLRFEALRLEPWLWGPEAQRAGQLDTWLGMLAGHNPRMDPATGVLDLDLPTPAPAWLEYLLMGSEYQLVVGQAGSKTLLHRAGQR